VRDDSQRLRDILDAIERIEKYASKGRDAFEREDWIQIWMVHHLQIIGEAARTLPEHFRNRHPQVPWKQIIAMRNILVHGYFHVDLDAVWAVVERDLEPLDSAVRQYVAGHSPPGTQAVPSSQVDPADEFHRDMVAGIDRLNREISYRATRFAQMVNEHGGVAAAKRLLASDQYSEGFTTLWEKHRLDMSVEAFVLLPWYRHLFTVAERTMAERRLRDHGFDVERFLQQRAADPPDWTR
jgi:uncharacterized protein with HEPN domain